MKKVITLILMIGFCAVIVIGCVYDEAKKKEEALEARPLIHAPDHYVPPTDDYPYQRIVSVDGVVHYEKAGTMPRVSTIGKYIYVRFENGTKIVINPFRDLGKVPMSSSEYDYRVGKFVEDTEKIEKEFYKSEEHDRPWGLFEHKGDEKEAQKSDATTPKSTKKDLWVPANE